MRRLIDLLAPLGIAVLVGVFVAYQMGKALPGKPSYYIAAGVVLILAHLVLRWEDVSRVVGRRQMRYGGNALLLSLAVLVVLVAINALLARHDKRWDLTKNARHSLSDQTRKVLDNLKQDVTIWYFQRSSAMEGAEDRMKLYTQASSRVKVEFVDPFSNPAKANAMDVRGPWPILVVEQGSKRERVNNDSEQDITNALIKLTHERKKTVCFVEGEGERDPDDTGERGFSAAKDALVKSQYEVKKVLLVRAKGVPDDCTVVAVAAPEKDPLAQVVDEVRAFVKKGGKALVFLEPPFKDETSNLNGMLKEWNIETGHDVVVDASGVGQLFGAGPTTPIVAQYPWHEITKDFRVMTAFDTARSVEPGKAAIDGVSVQPLLQTSNMSWAESDLTLKDPVELNEGKDRRGPITLGVAATVRVVAPSPAPSPSPSPTDAPEKKPEGRVVAVGDADFASNLMLGFQGNRDLFLNMVAWLSEDVDLISIRPREADDNKMFLTRSQQLWVLILALAVIPGLFVVLGVINWWQRR
jgi:ABC-type uncharacterized transport system involved in gliding motility auxiliary subunit